MEDRTAKSASRESARLIARTWGQWLDELGEQTSAGTWTFFATITFRSQNFPWARGFPKSGSGRPSPEFAHELFQVFIAHLESELGERIDFAVCDQLGKLNGRFHQHALLAGRSLGKDQGLVLERWLKTHAGLSRVLPFQRGAAYYVGRYLGRSAEDASWDIRVGEQHMKNVSKPESWGNVIVASADMPKGLFHQGLPGRRR